MSVKSIRQSHSSIRRSADGTGGIWRCCADCSEPFQEQRAFSHLHLLSCRPPCFADQCPSIAVEVALTRNGGRGEYERTAVVYEVFNRLQRCSAAVRVNRSFAFNPHPRRKRRWTRPDRAIGFSLISPPPPSLYFSLTASSTIIQLRLQQRRLVGWFLTRLAAGHQERSEHNPRVQTHTRTDMPRGICFAVQQRMVKHLSTAHGGKTVEAATSVAVSVCTLREGLQYEPLVLEIHRRNSLGFL